MPTMIGYDGKPLEYSIGSSGAGVGHYVKNLLVGGDATKGIDSKPRQYDAATQQLGEMASTAQGRAAPVFSAAQLDMGPQGQSRQGMMDVAGRLGGIANGMTPGAGELAVNRQLSAAQAAQNSAARMARGANSALVYRNAMRNQADMGLAGAGQAAAAQMQDQTAANQQLTSLYGTMRGQDIGVAGENAQLTQQANMANQGAQLTQQQMNDARQIQALGQQLGWDQARINAELAKAGIAMNDKGILPGLIQGGGQALAAYATGGMSAAGAGGAAPGFSAGGGSTQLMPLSMSDVRNKTAIEPGSAAAQRALASLPPYTFAYRDPQAYGQGPQLGVMAQDLERAGLAHTVVDTPKGKAVDASKLTTTNTALIGELAAKTRALEEDARRKDALLTSLSGGAGPQSPAIPSTWPGYANRFGELAVGNALARHPLPSTVPASQFPPDVQVLWPDGSAAPQVGLSPNRQPVPRMGRIGQIPVQ